MIQHLKGTQDYWPPQTQRWQYIESTMIRFLEQWGYEEVRTPIMEPLQVFEKLGADSDVVGKQMYRLDHPEAIVLRPEGTASILRSGIEHHTITRSPAKVWYYGPMFRHERPQKGRLRQFHQLGAEWFGHPGIHVDVEMLHMLSLLFQTLGLSNHIQLEINSLGSLETRARYKKALINYLMPYEDQLDNDSKRRLHSNPLRILDSKDPGTQSILMEAPILYDFLSPEERHQFEQITQQLDSLKQPWVHNPRLVRGLDYYNDLVFEFTTQSLGSQGTLCAGGRYDHMADGWGHRIHAIGFSIGMERILALMADSVPLNDKPSLIAFTTLTDALPSFMHLLAELRAISPFRVIMDYTEANFNKKYTRAIKKHPLAILTIEAEQWASQQCVLRRPHTPPILCAWDAQEILQQCQTL